MIKAKIKEKKAVNLLKKIHFFVCFYNTLNNIYQHDKIQSTTKYTGDTGGIRYHCVLMTISKIYIFYTG